MLYFNKLAQLTSYPFLFLALELTPTQPDLQWWVAAEAVVLVDGLAFWGREDPPAVGACVGCDGGED